jgi:plasmid stabilization system protein ParE
VFARLLDYPFQFPEIEEGARRALVRDFPYGVFFTAEDNLIRVLAVLHPHRHPDTWKDRR